MNSPVEVVVKKLLPEDIDKKFTERFGISKICAARCRNDLAKSDRDISTALHPTVKRESASFQIISLCVFNF